MSSEDLQKLSLDPTKKSDKYRYQLASFSTNVLLALLFAGAKIVTYFEQEALERYRGDRHVR